MPTIEQRRKVADRDEKIVKAIKAGELPMAVAERMGIKKSTIWAACNNNGISIQQIRRQRHKKIATFIEAGGSISEAREQFSVGTQAIRKACIECGVSVPKSITHSQAGAIAILRVMEDAPYGSTFQHVADQIGCTKSRVGQVWKTGQKQGFFDNVIWCNVTGKAPKPDHMKESTEAESP